MNANAKYLEIRQKTESFCSTLEIEDYVVQGCIDASPIKWHLAHTTWFFEQFILIPFVKNYRPFDPAYLSLFNSYYQAVSAIYPKSERGLLSRPLVKRIYAYRHYVDEHMDELLKKTSDVAVQHMLILGLNHEQQHQELMLMDIKFNYSLNGDFPVYKPCQLPQVKHIIAEAFIVVEAAQATIGYQGNGFCYDNELPKHQTLIAPFSIANRLVTNAEYQCFIEEGGYTNPLYWLADGWDCVLKNKWQAPLYWHQSQGKWYQFTLHGLSELTPEEPVCHISYYEADAYARYRGMRLPTELEWEYFVQNYAVSQKSNLMESGYFHPSIASDEESIPQQFFGDVWEWTMSSYSPYPGYESLQGALGEYNGKFMCNQMVLRGGSCVTPLSHIRASYRNFFQTEKRWQFSGIRLAT